MSAEQQTKPTQQPHYTVGIAGHIDHGKTTLTKALTGIDTDRLKEEHERNISIEVGYASFPLASGALVGIVDVPGHERFIRQMVAGVAGIDLVLVVIAADEGIMPQTREHIHILQLLGVSQGIIVLTKVDRVDDEFLDLVREQVEEETANTFLQGASMLEVDSISEKGLHQLKEHIQLKLVNLPSRPIQGITRYPVDRVFSKKGFGTVVTGTLYQGTITIGDELDIIPGGQKTKVRQLQVHGASQEKAYAGQRVAINLSGTDKDLLHRGHTLITPRSMQATQRIDIEFQMLDDLDFSCKQRSDIRLHIGTSEILGRIIFFDRNECLPGDTCLAQIELEEPVGALFQDRFVLRRPTPMTTIGGGMVIDPYATKHRFGPATIEAIKAKKSGNPLSRAKHEIEQNGIQTQHTLLNKLGLSIEEWQNELDQQDQPTIMAISSKQSSQILITTLEQWQHVWRQIDHSLADYHAKHPLKPGMERQKVQAAYFPSVQTTYWNMILEEATKQKKVRTVHDYICQYDFEIVPSDKDQKVWQDIQQQMQQSLIEVKPWQELVPKNASQDWAYDLQQWLSSENQLIALDEGRWLSKNLFDDLVQQLKSATPDTFSIQDVRQVFDTSRKYLIPFMETLDRLGYTIRIENDRRWKEKD